MAVANIKIEVNGALTSSHATCNAVGSSGTSGPTFQLGIRSDNSSASENATSTFLTVNSALAFIPLAMPANLRATFLYIKTLTSAKLTLRVTYELTGVVTEPIRGLWIKEFPSDDRVSLVEIQGQGDLEWYAAGGIV